MRNLNKQKEKSTEEFFAILFLYMADQQKYGKVIEDIENAVLQKKDLFTKSLSDVFRLLNRWCNNYGG